MPLTTEESLRLDATLTEMQKVSALVGDTLEAVKTAGPAGSVDFATAIGKHREDPNAHDPVLAKHASVINPHGNSYLPRWRIRGDNSYNEFAIYIRTIDGNDANDGSTYAKAVKSIERAYGLLKDYQWTLLERVFFVLGPGTYPRIHMPANSTIMSYDSTNHGVVDLLINPWGLNNIIQDITINYLRVGAFGNIRMSTGCRLGYVVATTGGVFSGDGITYTMIDSVYPHIVALHGGVVSLNGTTVNIERSTPVPGGINDGLYAAHTEGMVQMVGCTFVGSPVSGVRYNVAKGGRILTDGAGPNYLPGTAPGINYSLSPGYYF